MSRAPEVLVIVNDIHCGSTVGLMPPDFETVRGQRIGQNKLQQWLWECWNRANDKWLPEVLDGVPFNLLLLGDMMEGNHHGTKELISPDTADHANMAFEIIEPLAKKARRVFVVEGTECHTNSQEINLAKSLKGVVDPNTGKAAFDRLYLDVNGCRCVFRHHIGTTIRPWLEATQLSIHLAAEQVEAAKAGHPIPKVLGCAHRHKFGRFEDGTGLCFVSPPWQGLTRHGHKVVSHAVTKPGLVVMDWRGKKPGSLPELHHEAYIPAAPVGVTM